MPARSLYARLSVSGAAATAHVRVASIDALRALAALMVLAAHAYVLGGPVTPSPSSAGYTISNALACGVWLFFAISGYLIAGPFLRALVRGEPLPPVGRYGVRRAARILPAYWVALAAILILATGSAVTHWWQLPVHALLPLQVFFPYENQRLFFVAWTLGIEALFYVLVPLAALLVRRITGPRPLRVDRVAAGLLTFWVLTFAWGLGLSLAHPFSANKVMPGLFTVLYIVLPVGNFCPGMLVYLASLDAAAGTWCARVRGVVARRPAPSLAVVIALWIVSQELPWLTNPVAFAVFDPLVGVASGLVLAVVLARPERVEPVARVLAPLGLVSFGIYLWHWVLLAVLLVNNGFPVHGFGAVPMVLHVVVLLGLTVPVAVVSWLVLERPLLRRTALWDRRGVRPAVEATAAGEAADGRALLARG